MNRLLILLFLLLINFKLPAQEIAFTISEKDLVPEGITFDPVENTFYLSSIFKNKIVVRSTNTANDFIKATSNGFAGGVGLHVDSARRILWACSGNILGKKFRTGIFAYDLRTGKLIKKVFYPIGSTKYFFNDLVIANNGEIYITNTPDHSIWKWGMNSDRPIKLNLSDSIEYPNGITISPDQKILFLATEKGLVSIDIKSGITRLIQMPAEPVTSIDLDGILFYKNSIIGVQNGFASNSDMQVVRYFLSGDFTTIEKTEIIDKGNKYFDIPTTLTLANGDLYVIANSQIDNLDQENLKIKDPGKLTETVILKYKLR